MARAEQLLRESALTTEELAKALPYMLSRTHPIIRELLGRDGMPRKIFISGWDVQRTRRISRKPRFRWITAAQADVAPPSIAECEARLARKSDIPRATCDLMAALYGRRA